jgi:(2Fe-2S) ferredoxin
MQFMICAGTGCIASGSLAFKEALKKELVRRKLDNDVQIVMTGCNGFCAMGPIVVTYPEGVFTTRSSRNTRRIVEEHVLKGRVARTSFSKRRRREPSSGYRLFGRQRLIVCATVV